MMTVIVFLAASVFGAAMLLGATLLFNSGFQSSIEESGNSPAKAGLILLIIALAAWFVGAVLCGEAALLIGSTVLAFIWKRKDIFESEAF